MRIDNSAIILYVIFIKQYKRYKTMIVDNARFIE